MGTLDWVIQASWGDYILCENVGKRDEILRVQARGLSQAARVEKFKTSWEDE